MKRIFAFLVALTLCFSFSSNVFAADANAESIDYMNYNFPEDAKILYQGEDGVIYQSKEENYASKSMQYNYVWINAGTSKTGNFSMTNPHPLGGTTNGTFKIESDYSNASGQMVLHNGIFLLADETLSVSDGDVHFSFSTVGSNLVVTYYTGNISSTYGMRMMCWLW